MNVKQRPLYISEINVCKRNFIFCLKSLQKESKAKPSKLMVMEHIKVKIIHGDESKGGWSAKRKEIWETGSWNLRSSVLCVFNGFAFCPSKVCTQCWTGCWIVDERSGLRNASVLGKDSISDSQTFLLDTSQAREFLWCTSIATRSLVLVVGLGEERWFLDGFPCFLSFVKIPLSFWFLLQQFFSPFID